MGMARAAMSSVEGGVSESVAVVVGFWRARKAERAWAFEAKTNTQVLSSTHSRPRGWMSKWAA